MKEAMFYDRGINGQVQCSLCRFNCLINDGDRGICAVRENRGGSLYSLVYGKLSAQHVDPIEKKPLFHVMPGSKSYSIASMGCNFHCHHCQNFTISQVSQNASIHGTKQTPQEVVQRAVENKCLSISYTYNEPTVFYEFVFDTARLAREAGLKNVFVTNGYISKKALATLAPYLDAANIDLKGFSEEFYRKYVQAHLYEVLNSIIEYRSMGIWIELTTLIIPGLNDTDAELKNIAEFIVANLGNNTPWHVSQFYPTYKLTDRSRTPASTLRRACDIGRAAGLHYTYGGNVPGGGNENTECPYCSRVIIKRFGYEILSNRINKGKCPDCGAAISGINM